MGAWGISAFDNDNANDWAYGLEETADLSLVESALAAVEQAEEYLEAPEACHALAACEVLARLKGRPGYTNAFTEKVDQWVAAHPLTPPAALVCRALSAIDRILGADSELCELWGDSDDDAHWLAAVEDLRHRVGG
jgi:hypothetical protein